MDSRGKLPIVPPCLKCVLLSERMVERSYVIIGFHQLVSCSVRNHVIFRLLPCILFFPILIPHPAHPLPHFAAPSLWIHFSSDTQKICFTSIFHCLEFQDRSPVPAIPISLCSVCVARMGFLIKHREGAQWVEGEGSTLTILLSEILEILAMSRVTAIWTGSPKNGENTESLT